MPERTRPQPSAKLAALLGVTIDQTMLLTALTHRSYAYENGNAADNERLEFLGDAVLSIVVTDSLYRRFPDLPEGKLAKMRASVVNMRALAEVARGIGPEGLGAYLRLGRGEEATGGRDKSSILADALEAILGTIYIEVGIDEARRVVHTLFEDRLANTEHMGAALDWKTSLQELTAALGLGVPGYDSVSEGPDHERRFTARVRVASEEFLPCTGRNKKEAEQAAAAAAWTVLRSRLSAAQPELSELPGDPPAEVLATQLLAADPSSSD